MKEIIWTDEQKIIISTETSFLLILAFAGTGKTTVLQEYVRVRPNKKFLYTSFNKHTINEAKNKFQENADLYTLHGLAYKEIGNIYKNKISYLNIKDLFSILKLDYNSSSLFLIQKVFDIIQGYSQSRIKILDNYINTLKIDHKISKLIRSFSNRVWESLIDTQNDYSIDLDILFKIYCNSDPVLDYDYILLDEGQDSNDISKELIISQLKFNKKIMIIGDKHQALYKFRGSKNILSNIIASKICYLTKSFRFGKNIAIEANKILNILKEKKKIIGNEKIQDKVGKINKNIQYTIINRTNGGVLSNALKSLKLNKKIYFIGGIESYNFYKALDINYFYRKEYSKIKNKKILSYISFDELIESAYNNKDKELFLYAKLVLKTKGHLDELIFSIEKHTTKNINDADVILTNVHKSKGLEFNQVLIGNDYLDFKKIKDDISINYDNIIEELNILYVAITRAINILEKS